jgi:3-demethoxyubiquinol 3-hydroxylase
VAHGNRGETLGARYLRVDHAGEHGAANLYWGQLIACRWRSEALRRELQEFQSHEQHHRAKFVEGLNGVAVIICAVLGDSYSRW